ncbi:uncharacterized protein LOC117317702 [Pecten maximus]|uniref:uncharacterized protein LOC117317702 n=1 Tax=Pecten maximus TaxID=6579 RepID=UPI001458405D|nr:uncharacterized protein LOC117317702 [Pecten maximus]
MFSAIAEKFTKGVTSDDAFVPVRSIASAHDLKLFQIVVKRTKTHCIFWEKVIYKPYDFELNEVLLNSHSPVHVDETSQEGFCRWHRNIEFSLSGKFGAAIREELGDVSFSTSSTLNIEANLGQLNLVQLDSGSLERELIKRRIDLSHVLIEQIRRKKNSVLCVVHSIVKLAQNAEIRRTSDIDIEGKASAGIPGVNEAHMNMEGGLDDKTVRDIGLLKGQPIAYKVWELQVDKHGGEIVPCITSDISGGFMNGEDIIGRPLQPASTIDSTLYTRENIDGLEIDGAGIHNFSSPVDSPEKVSRILQPVFSMAEVDRGKIKELLFNASAEDFEKLDILFDQVENRFGDPNTDDPLTLNQIGDLKFSNQEICRQFLLLAGFEHKGEENIRSPPVPTPEFEACCRLIEAMEELPENVMTLVRKCRPDLCVTLRHVIEQFLERKPMVEFTRHVEELARDEVGMELLKVLNIEVDMVRKNPLIARNWRLADCVDELYWWLCAIYLR